MPTNAELEKQILNLSTLLKDGIADIKKTVQDNKDELSAKIDVLVDKVNVVETTLERHDERMQGTENEIGELRATLNNHIDQNKVAMEAYEKRLKEMKEQHEVDVKQLREEIEERTNRQLRETLIFKNIPENGKETYEQTRELLADLISQHSDISYDVAFAQIKRCHREGEIKDENDYRLPRKGKRHIYAGFVNWYVCQQIIKAFRHKCTTDDEFSIYVDQKYGTLTTKRRSLALHERKTLKNRGQIEGGYLRYPARLYVTTGVVVNGKKSYVLHKDFSKVDVDDE